MKFYSLIHRDKEIQKKSSSGGAFTAISDSIIANKGLVIGGGYNYETNKVEPIVCRTPEERDQLRGSKYIQSDLKEIFRQIKAFADEKPDQRILFVGTPCQVAGLKSFLVNTSTDCSEIYLCDIVCHGVPSPEIWRDFIHRISNGATLDNVTFKDKRIGWQQPLAFATINGKEKTLRAYTLLYFGELITRPSCGKCPYASLDRISDITIGDHWGIQRVDPQFYSKDGTSLIITNTEKGEELLRLASNSVMVKERTSEECMQPNLIGPSKPSKKRISFWNAYRNHKRFSILWYDLVITSEKIKKRLGK